jgi:glycosyltransferase involved in cell wall biosynthesis
MNKPALFNQYRQHYSTAGKWNLISPDTENTSQVVVIPAYAEKEMLFSTLASLAQNQPSSLDCSFVLCVINNKKNSPDEVKKNNQQTLEYLRVMINKKSLNHLALNEDTKRTLQLIADSRLRLGYIDASSAGSEIPDNAGGVGMARKIGMDAALSMMQKNSAPRSLILSLDADTLVQTNYLSAIKNYFTKKVKTAVVAYEHQEPLSDEGRAAIYCYEIFLRYWILGLKFAKSPYAFHSIGSTMVCSTDAYLAVRGMNKREAGEDFYFLNKLAKIGNVDYIKKTSVYPSARESLRVPFGTGKRVQRFLAGSHEEYVLYDPRIFEILAQWLFIMETPSQYDEKQIMKMAGLIDPLLASFLADCNFAQVWSRIRANVKNEDALTSQFHRWFDGFKTLKLINYLTKEFYSPIDMFTALEMIFKMKHIVAPEFVFTANPTDLPSQKIIVEYLRTIT